MSDTPERSEADKINAREAARTASLASHPRVSERDLAFAVADWLGGADFSPVMWAPARGVTGVWWAEGDVLFVGRGVRREFPTPLLDRTKLCVPATPAGHNVAEISDGRALCRYVLIGDHVAMWGEHPGR